MQHIDWVLWMILAPLLIIVSEYLEAKIKQSNGIDYKERNKNEKESDKETYSAFTLFYIIMAITLW